MLARKENIQSKDAPPVDDWTSDVVAEPPRRGLWQGLDGIAVMTFGVALPGFLIALCASSMAKRLTLVLLNHPLETLAELALVSGIPVMNYLVWASICKGNVRFSRARDIALGGAIGASLIVSIVCAAGLFVASGDVVAQVGTAFATGFAFISAVGLMAACAGIYLVYRIRLTREFPRSRAQLVGCAITGAVLSLMAVVAAEARPWCIRIAQRMAVSSSAVDRRQGLDWLRAPNPERELRMECADQRAAGLSGMFIPVKSTTQHQLYFALTGKPYSYRDSHNNDLSSMPDDYLSRHVVGEKIEGLSLVRSKIDGTVHPDTLSSTVNWTMVFKNDSTTPQEVRAELKVPQGAALTGLRVWNNGEPRDASFAATGDFQGIQSWVRADHTSPAIITHLGRDRVLLHAYPVPQEEEMKVQVTMVVPLKPDGPKSSTLVLPRFIASNFGLSGEHQLRLRSSMRLSSGMAGLKESTSAIGEKVLFGDLRENQLDSSDLMVTASRLPVNGTIAVLDKLAVELEQAEAERQEEARRAQSANTAARQQLLVMIDGSKNIQNQLNAVTAALHEKNGEGRPEPLRIKAVKPQYVRQSIEPIASPSPRHLVVVVDGSVTVESYKAELCRALERLPADIPTSLVIASQERKELMEPAPLAKGIERLRNMQFVGGQDNLQAVVKASELAGETTGGAVLWIHGPQPVLNREIYIMAPYAATPAFYELPLDTGDADTVEFFKNHSEIGPFVHIARDASLSKDLDRFFARWQPGSHDYVVGLSQATALPKNLVPVSDKAAGELIALHANQQCEKLLALRKPEEAMKIAVAYGLVTPVSSALVHSLDRNKQVYGDSLAYRDSDSQLQGATNGTVGPQSGDVTVVQGINTAGTVRVNNLANLEALLNIIANLLEVGGCLAGFAILLHGVLNRTTVTQLMGASIQLTPARRVAIGISLIFLGLATPGILNWFIASARDANLFS
jgi:hypothetical protein